MLTNPSFPDRLKGGSPVLAAWCGLPDPAIPGLLAREAFDAVVIDLQHGAIDFAPAMRAVPLIAAAGKPAMVRIPVGDFTYFTDKYDGNRGGRAAILAPDILDRAEFSAGGFGVRYGDRMSSAFAKLTESGSRVSSLPIRERPASTWTCRWASAEAGLCPPGGATSMSPSTLQRTPRSSIPRAAAMLPRPAIRHDPRALSSSSAGVGPWSCPTRTAG